MKYFVRSDRHYLTVVFRILSLMQQYAEASDIVKAK